MKYSKYPSYRDSGVEWLGETPCEWDVTKHKYIATFSKGKNPSKLHNDNIEGTKKYLSMDYLRGTSAPLYGEIESNSYVVEDSQPLIIWDGSNAGEFVSGVHGILSSTMAASTLLTRMINNKYYWYVCKTIEPEMRRHSNGMGIPHVNGMELRNINLLHPPLQEQQAIANYLDIATDKIDTLISKQTKLIELLKEKRQALISHAVTKGLNPHAKMKQSGVEWLGEIPEHWENWKFIHFAPIITCGLAATPTYVEEGIPFLSAQNIQNGRLSLHKYNFIAKELHKQLTKNRKPEAGDLLVTRVGAKIGEACVLETDMEFSIYVSLSQIRLNDSIALAKYIKYFLASSYCNVLNSLATEQGGGVGNLNVKNVERYKVPLSSLREQQAIANYLDDKTQKIDNLIEKATKAIELLKERRTVLISSAVTGKIDVRDMA